MPIVGNSTLLHRRNHPACKRRSTLYQSDDQQLQAADTRFRGSGALLAYSSRNLPAACRIPYVASPKGAVSRPGCQPLAGLRGIQNKIHPGDPIDKNLCDLPPEELSDVPVVRGSLRQALGELRNDYAFSLKGDIFSIDQLE